MRISDWSSDVCSSDLIGLVVFSLISGKQPHYLLPLMPALMLMVARGLTAEWSVLPRRRDSLLVVVAFALLAVGVVALPVVIRSEERRVGQEWGVTGRFRWSPDHYKKKKQD